MELRELYRELGWDEDISTETKKRWIEILLLTKEAEKLQFKRCVRPYNAEGNPDL